MSQTAFVHDSHDWTGPIKDGEYSEIAKVKATAGMAGLSRPTYKTCPNCGAVVFTIPNDRGYSGHYQILTQEAKAECPNAPASHPSNATGTT